MSRTIDHITTRTIRPGIPICGFNGDATGKTYSTLPNLFDEGLVAWAKENVKCDKCRETAIACFSEKDVLRNYSAKVTYRENGISVQVEASD